MNVKWLLRRWLLVVAVLLWPAVSQAAEVTVKLAISPGGDHMYVQMSKPCLSGYHPHPLYVVCTHFPE